MRLIRTAGALCATLVLALTGCASGGDDATDSKTQQDLSSTANYNPQPRDKVKDGGTFTTSLAGALYEQLNPMHADMNGGVVELARWNTPQLQLLTPEGEVTWDDDYVSDVSSKVVGGNRVVTFTINDKATFNDGTAIDWRAFATIWKVMNGSNKAYSVNTSEGYRDISSVKAGASAKQAVVTYDGTGLFWESQFSTVLHPAVADPNTFNTAYVKNLHNEWGAGPYRVKSLEDTAIVYERNPKWWGEPGKLDQRTFRFMEATAAVNAFRNGEIDAVDTGTREALSQVQSMSGIDIRSAMGTGSAMLQINPEAPLLKDVDTRRGIALAFDRKTLEKIQFDGVEKNSALEGSLTFFPFQSSYRDTYAEAGGTFDPKEAASTLDKAGWVAGKDGIREKDGKRLSLVWPITTETTTAKNVGLAAQQMMKQVGVELTIDFRGSSETVATYDERQYDILFGGWGLGSPDEGLIYFCSLFCTDNGATSRANVEALAPKAVEAAKLDDHDVAVKTYLDLEKAAFEQFDIVPLWNNPKIVSVKQGLANYGASMFYRGRIQDLGWQQT